MQLIINADDFGLTSGVNRGILDCFLAGSVTSTTLMVNTPATLEAIEMAKANPGLGIGLHFNLTLDRPLCSSKEVPTLVDSDGNFPGRAACERKLLLGKVKVTDIEREFHAQLDRFTSFGIPLTHIDSHQHIHLFPRVFDVLARCCAERDIPLRLPWLWQGRGGDLSLRKKVRAMLLGLLVRRHAGKWQKKIRTNQAFASVFDLISNPAQITRQTYDRLLAAPGGSPLELMVHPAVVDDQLRAMTRITAFSEAEYRLLSDPGFGKEIVASGFELVSYREAFAGR